MLDTLEKDANRPNYGSRYYKPKTVRGLIKIIRRLKNES